MIRIINPNITEVQRLNTLFAGNKYMSSNPQIPRQKQITENPITTANIV